ncbi:T6SS immunity protein Tli3 family protein [Buttiauxella agrestis]
MKGFNIIMLMLFVTGCHARQQIPTQVVYRFDDHRYLELKGFNCEGELWYIDTQRGIRSEPVSQFYRIFTHKFVHPSERYIALTGWDAGGFMISKDYGQTWNSVGFSPGPNEPNGMNQAPRGDAISFTVVNDQGFLQTKHSLYMSSKPFEDPRILPGGPGIPFTSEDGANHILEPQSPGEEWGMVYMTRKGLVHNIGQFKTNWQDLPNQVPEVKDYKGWDHMSCDMDAGK